MSNINIEYNLTFNNAEYFLYLYVIDDCLKLNLEQVDESLYWKAEYEGKYIEEITNKAGSYKSFQVFIKMLMSALSKESESVVIDLLSFKDLEQMKMKKMQANSLKDSYNYSESGIGFNTGKMNANTLSNTNDPIKMNKRYFIMSYSNEFEKVHYPIPLQFMTTPDNEMLFRTIQRIKKQNNPNISYLKNSGMYSNSTNTQVINFKEFEESKTENQNLRNKIKLLESQRKMGAVENEEFIRMQLSVKEEYERYKTAAEAKMKLLVQTVEELKNKLNSNNSNNFSNSKENDQMNYIKELEAKLEKASEIVINERRSGQSFIDEKIKEIEKLKKEIISLKEDEKKNKVKINQLEKDLEIENRRNIYQLNNLKNKNYSSTINSKKSFKVDTVRSNFSNSNASSKKSVTNSTSSNVKKNLQSNPYNKYKGLHNKNYTPFQFFEKNKNKSKNSSIKSKSVKSVKSNSNASGVYKEGNNITINSKKLPSYYTNSSTNKTKNTTKISKTNNYTNSSNLIPKVYSNKNNTGKFTNPANKTANKSLKINNTANNLLVNNSLIKTNNFMKNNNTLIEEKLKILNKFKSENETNMINQNDINERLGRIQNLLDSAKV
jgi:coiled-coil domain-containing protein 61